MLKDGDDPLMRGSVGSRMLLGLGWGRCPGPGAGPGRWGMALGRAAAATRTGSEPKSWFTARRVSVYSMALFLEPKLTANRTVK